MPELDIDQIRTLCRHFVDTMPEDGLEETLATLRDYHEFYRTPPPEDTHNSMNHHMSIHGLRAMARAPQFNSVYTLAGALHEALDRLEVAERERDELCIALRQAEAERLELRTALYRRTRRS